MGGFVRDSLMGRSADDVDIATNAHWTLSKKAFEQAGFLVHETGTKHGTITAVVHDMPIEVTTYRIDGPYSDGRHPDSVHFARSIEDDLARRDFTINAIAYHPERGVFDPCGGMADIDDGVIRTVGDPMRRFGEDSLRLLRSARFQSQLGFEIEPDTACAMKNMRDGLSHVAVERQMHEWDKLLCGDHVCRAILDNVDVLGVTIPEILPMRGFDQKTFYHCYDVLEHTAHVVEHTSPTPLLRWAALLHDIGKPAMFTIDQHGQGHFKGHAAKSAEMARVILARLKVSPAFARKVVLLVERHDDRADPTLKSVKRQLAKLDHDPSLFYALCDLKRADARAHAPDWREHRVEQSYEMEAYMDAILSQGQAFRISDLAIDGADVLAAGVEQGPDVGKILERCLDAVICEEISNEREELISFIEEIRSSGNHRALRTVLS